MAFRLSWLGRRRASGATLVLSMPHPAQRHFDQALEQVAHASRPRPLVRSEGRLRGLTPDRVAGMAAKAAAAGQHLIIHATLLPDAKLVPLFDRAIVQVAGVVKALGSGTRIVLLWAGQDRLVEITYIRQAENGSPATFEEHVKRALDAELSYTPFVQRLQSVPGVASVTCVDWALAEQRLSPIVAAVVEPVVKRTSASTLAELDRPAVVRGYASRRGVEVAQAMHPFVDTPEERALIRSFVREHFRARKMADTMYLDDRERQQLLEPYTQEIRDLRSRSAG